MTLQQLENMEPDEKGIIVFMSETGPRRFEKEKFLNYLRRAEVEEVIPSSFIIPKVKYAKRKRNAVGVHRKVPVIAILPDGTEQRFDSGVAAAKNFGMNQTNVSNIIKGRQGNRQGIKFKYA